MSAHESESYQPWLIRPLVLLKAPPSGAEGSRLGAARLLEIYGLLGPDEQADLEARAVSLMCAQKGGSSLQIEEVRSVVCREAGVTEEYFLGRKRWGALTRARRVFALAARRLGFSWHQITVAMGRKSVNADGGPNGHQTAMSAYVGANSRPDEVELAERILREFDRSREASAA